MIDLKTIKQKKEILKCVNKIDFSDINGEVIEYSLSAELIEFQRDYERTMEKHHIAKMKKLINLKGSSKTKQETIDAYVEKVGSKVVDKELNKIVLSKAENFISLFENAPKTEEIKEYIYNLCDDIDGGEFFAQDMYFRLMTEYFNEFLTLVGMYYNNTPSTRNK